jgi:molybdopterin/thiamine biosynthesis adenylyltransferase
MNFSRQMDLANPSIFSKYPITVIGAGGIGAATVLTLAKVGFDKIVVYDYDRITDVNYPNQMLPMVWYKESIARVMTAYPTSDQPKVDVLKDMVANMTKVEIVPRMAWFKEQTLTDIVICAVDNMKTRRDIWAHALIDPDILLYVDGRMAGNDHTIYSVDMLKDSCLSSYSYETTLYSDEDAVQVPCTAKSTIYTNLNIASLITDICVRWALGEYFPRLICSNMRAFTMNVSRTIQ